MILFDPDQPESAGGFPKLNKALSVPGVTTKNRAPLPSLTTLVRYLREAQAAVRLKGDVCVLLTTDDGIRSLNQRFRKKNKATDVLSFPAVDDEFLAPNGIAGDLAISVETAARQASEQGHTLRVELRVLMLHGLLHLAGYDHERDDGVMARKERRLRTRLRLPQGLIERMDDDAAAPASRQGAVTPRSATQRPAKKSATHRASVARRPNAKTRRSARA